MSDPDAPRRRPWLRILGGAMGGLALLCGGTTAWIVGVPCVGLAWSYGVWVDTCPTGQRLAVGARVIDVGRLHTGVLHVEPRIVMLRGDPQDPYRSEQAIHRGLDVSVSLQDAEGQEVEGWTLKPTDDAPDPFTFDLTLPDVSDGDYVLRVVARGGLGEDEVGLDLPLYTPALSHVLTDRPLVRPGDVVQARVVMLSHADRTPLADRAGTWHLQDPSGRTVWSEKGRTGPHGVAATDFPLVDGAETGRWTVRWDSGDDHAEATVRVEAFELPRLELDLASAHPWRGPGDPVLVTGQARLASGPPLRGVPVQWHATTTEGRWPVPIRWEDGGELTTDDAGRFTVDLGVVPQDLVDRATVTLTATVRDETGETRTAQAPVVLSTEPLKVAAVTELSGGLAGGFPNRVYLRVTTPDGQALPDTAVAVRNPWSDDDPTEATTDADGVVAVRLDPGDPVTVVTEPTPVRTRPRVERDPQLVSVSDVGTGRTASGAVQSALGTRVGAVDRCRTFLPAGDDDARVSLALATDRSGRVVEVVPGASGALADCVADALRPTRLPVDTPHTLELTWSLPAAGTPWVEASVSVAGSPHPPLAAVVERLEEALRPCAVDLPAGSGRIGPGGRIQAHLSMTEGRTDLGRRWSSAVPSVARRCLDRALAPLSLDEPAPRDLLAVLTLQRRDPAPEGPGLRSPTTREAYELEVATADGERAGTVRLDPGRVPPLRLRVEPSLVQPGETVALEVFRGPDWRGELPEALTVEQGRRVLDTLDLEDRSATWTVPDEARGFFWLRVGGAEQAVFVAEPEPLEVALEVPDTAVHPGQPVTVGVSTTQPSGPVPATVALAGVDTRLGALATLPAPDALGQAVVTVSSDRPAFGVFGPAALVLGQIRGEAAAQAALRTVSDPGRPRPLEARVSEHGTSETDERAILVEQFQRVQLVLLGQVAAWEDTAPDTERMTPERMMRMWEEAVAAVSAAGEPPVDAFGRPLTLGVLPGELLAEVDPRAVVRDATRLPDDVVNWTRFVREEGRR